jgi:hypothetical protein
LGCLLFQDLSFCRQIYKPTRCEIPGDTIEQIDDTSELSARVLLELFSYPGQLHPLLYDFSTA